MPFDQFGTKLIYASSRKNPQSYYYNGYFDSRVVMRREVNSPVHKFGNIFTFDEGNEDGQLDFLTSSKYNPALIIPADHSRFSVQKNMQDVKDWTNLECTVYANIKSSGKLIWRVRTGLDRQKSGDCESCGYEAELNVSGMTRFVKRFYCGASQYKPFVTSTDDIEERWVGFKFVVFNNEKNGSVSLEIHLDENNSNNWVPKSTFTDFGFGNLGVHCNGASNQIITWGGPITSLFWKSIGPQSVEFKNLSIREIDVNGSFSGQEGL